jgi:hypothetical protein
MQANRVRAFFTMRPLLVAEWAVTADRTAKHVPHVHHRLPPKFRRAEALALRRR